ncbi:MAG: preprotein translocase subunit SecE, partial [Caulobacteraceae bacterium]
GVKAPAAGGQTRSARTPAVKPAAASSVAAAAAPARRRTSPSQFIQEVRIEARKISWTSWKETWITSVMVFIMVTLTALFFWLVDMGLTLLMQQILKLAS